jgi:hypothetical protein
MMIRHLILKKYKNLKIGNPHNPPNPDISGFIQPDPILKWVVILLNSIRSTLYGSGFGFA